MASIRTPRKRGSRDYHGERTRFFAVRGEPGGGGLEADRRRRI
jgi:hypothetical protein